MLSHVVQKRIQIATSQKKKNYFISLQNFRKLSNAKTIFQFPSEFQLFETDKNNIPRV